MKFGFVAVIGRPNVGKSTLVNALCASKVAIVSPVAQTTRTALRGIVNTDDAQLVLVDTPGIHKPQTLLGSRLNDLSRRMLGEVDAVAFVVDVAGGIGRGDKMLAGWLPDDAPVVCVLNKTDRADPAAIARGIEEATTLRGPDTEFRAFVPTSARDGDGIDALRAELVDLLPEGDAMFPADMPTDQSERHLVAELVREQLLLRTRDEIPHSIAVIVDDVEGLDDPETVVRFECVVYVERESQKGIVIGKGGGLLKEAGQAARGQIEALLGRHVYVGLKVKVSKEWQRRGELLNRLGY